MYCETCDEKCDAVLDCGVKHHPEVLVLLLKRFEFDYKYMTYVKVKQLVNVPNTLQISGNQSYELYALVEHSGELRYGHYISTIRSQDDGKWYQFNDSQVAPHKAPPALERSRSAYLLFYQKLKETPLNGTGDINETTEEDQDPDPNKPENEETPGSSAQKRDGPFDEADQKGQKFQDLDIGSSSSSLQTCDPYVAESKKESEGKVDNSITDTEFSDDKEHCLNEENVKIEQESQSEMKQQLVSEAKKEKNYHNINLEKLKITEKSDFSLNGQGGSNIDARVKSEETVKVERRLITKYDLHHSMEMKQSNRWDREKHNTVQPVQKTTTNQAEYYSSGVNKEVFKQENALDTSCNVHSSGMAGHLERHVTVTGMEYEKCVVTIEGNAEVIKITPKKRQNMR
ncbi:uncharacterized protein [Eucyclogobius newberryi]|uniref:uncharacterized protein n=1 Tax=Eucyclogobius newberryi TaxID=166745 RepID=UPI003B5A0E17